MKLVSYVVAAISAIFVTDAAAQTSSTPRTDGRQATQKARVKTGEMSGQVTEQEKRKLDRGQKKVQRKENRAMRDGKVTPKERARLEKAQDKQSAEITKQKNDKQAK
jgi:Ni/Co efflux regulator RcnB